ncbi:hypothetical protein [Deinococcus puniceus]|uniref:Uncharacterized protein n=1 Tax=Deinococcus puniceus TaxID=1182568 RepID=A0A172T9W5_9DEIO|nr:hypothetical protein [Deinococcus puniceus]ANE43809.1 hypothetical protein SU48_08500 [Deinococcus puniceus]
MRAAHQFVLWGTAALLSALLLLGLSLQLGLRTTAVRWPHHVLFFAVCAGVLLSSVLALWAGARGWALLPALALLLMMSRTRPGKSAHWRLALACALAFAGGMWAAW